MRSGLAHSHNATTICGSHYFSRHRHSSVRTVIGTIACFFSAAWLIATGSFCLMRRDSALLLTRRFRVSRMFLVR
jgi:hypothetical protein